MQLFSLHTTFCYLKLVLTRQSSMQWRHIMSQRVYVYSASVDDSACSLYHRLTREMKKQMCIFWTSLYCHQHRHHLVVIGTWITICNTMNLSKVIDTRKLNFLSDMLFTCHSLLAQEKQPVKKNHFQPNVEKNFWKKTKCTVEMC